MICGEKRFLIWKLLVWKIFLAGAPGVPGIVICTVMQNKHVHVYQFIRRKTSPIVFTILTWKFYTVPLHGKYLKSNMVSVGTERQELSKFIISVEMIITGSSVLCWDELKKEGFVDPQSYEVYVFLPCTTHTPTHYMCTCIHSYINFVFLQYWKTGKILLFTFN
jgi:hypothetical protein